MVLVYAPVGDQAWVTGSLNQSLFPSTEPTVVFAALARWATTEFCHACSLTMSSGSEGVFRITEQGVPEAAAAVEQDENATAESDFLASVHFAVAAEYGYPAYSGVIEFSWRGSVSTDSNRVAAAILVDRATACVQSCRLAERAAAADDRSARLLLELHGARMVGQAIGLLMGSKQIGEREAEEFIRRGSYSASSTTAEFAAALVHSAGSEFNSTAIHRGRGHLRVVDH